MVAGEPGVSSELIGRDIASTKLLPTAARRAPSRMYNARITNASRCARGCVVVRPRKQPPSTSRCSLWIRSQRSLERQTAEGEGAQFRPKAQGTVQEAALVQAAL